MNFLCSMSAPGFMTVNALRQTTFGVLLPTQSVHVLKAETQRVPWIGNRCQRLFPMIFTSGFAVYSNWPNWAQRKRTAFRKQMQHGIAKLGYR